MLPGRGRWEEEAGRKRRLASLEHRDQEQNEKVSWTRVWSSTQETVCVTQRVCNSGFPTLIICKMRKEYCLLGLLW